MEGKWFWTTREDAERFARFLARISIGPMWIVEARGAEAISERLASRVTDGRPARYVEQSDLDWFNGLLMDLVLLSPAPGGSSG